MYEFSKACNDNQNVFLKLFVKLYKKKCMKNIMKTVYTN